jgi:PAS domain S-box-containing protein
MKNKNVIFSVFLLFAFHFILSPSHLFAVEKGPHGIIRVGTFPFEPFNFVDDNGMTQGLNADLLRELVKDEDWSINFIPGSWAEGLERLKNQEIDLLVSVAYSEERSKIMDFSYESVAELWGQVFLRPEGKSYNISDLSGRRVAIMRKDISGNNFIKTAEQLGVRCEIVEVSSHYDVFAAVKNGDVDAGVAPQHFGLRHINEYGLVPSTILFSPFSIYFASKKGTQHELLSHIDAHLSRWKKDRHSFYYQRQNYWLSNRQLPWQWPSWLIYVFLGATCAIVIFASFIYFLNKLVKKRTRELQVSEEKHGTIIQTAMDGFLLFNDQGKLFEVNQSYCKMSGYSTQELLAMNIADIEVDESKVNLAQRLEKITRLGSDRFETTHRCKSGALIYVEISAQYHPVNDGQFVAFVQDITERKIAEQALKESEERLQLVMEGSQLGYWDWDIETGGVRRNKHWAEMLGYTLKEIEESVHQWTDLHHPDDRAAAWQSINDHLEGKTSAHRMEYRMRAKNGQYRWILDQARIVKRNAEGKPIRMSGTHTDITERKWAENELIGKDALLRAMVRNLPFDFWARDIGQRVIIQSDESIRFWGDLSGTFLEDDQSSEEIIRQWKANNSAVMAGKVISEDCTYTSQTGEQREFHGLVVPIREGETILGILGINIDITERKQAEREKQELQSQLVQAQKMEAIGTLAGGIAHDFNNILGAIIGYSEMARDACPSDSDIARDLEKVLAAAQRSAELVKQILAFSRQSKADSVPLQPAPLIKEAIKLLRPALPTTIEIKQTLDGATRNILANPTQIHQIVLNICTNAFHAMEDTGGVLAITLQETALYPQDLKQYPSVQPGNFVKLTISNTGPEIPKEILNRIFDPYFTTKEVGKGTGLGLSVVHGIVSSMGGFITCESERGHGVEFHIFIPAIEAESIAATKEDDVELTGKERILLIDDEELLVDVGKSMLERLGYQVTTRSSSLDALETFQNQPQDFDAIITDQTMPGMTGFDLARRMLQIRPDIPIILCTGYSSIINEEQAHRYGIKGFVTKPFSKKELGSKLRMVLEHEKLSI